MGWGKKNNSTDGQFTGAHVGQLVTGIGSDVGKSGHVVSVEGQGDNVEYVTDKGDRIHIDNVRGITT